MKTKPFLKSMALVICCLTSFVLVSCDKDDDKPNLKISPNKVEVAVGKTVTVSVSNGTAPYTTKSSDAKIAVATPLADQYIKDNCPRTRLGGAHNTTVFICNNGDNEYTYDQLIAKFSPK